MALPPRLYESISSVPWDRAQKMIAETLRDVVRALDRGLTLSQNMSGEVRSAKVTGGQPLSLAVQSSLMPMAVLVVRCTQSSSPEAIIGSQPWVDWSFAPGQSTPGSVNIRAISGLTSGVEYDVTFWVVGG